MEHRKLGIENEEHITALTLYYHINTEYGDWVIFMRSPIYYRN